MKRPYSHSILSAALALFVFLLFAASAQAKMMYYTYEGTYTSEYITPPPDWSGREVPPEIYRLGTPASYTFGIDFASPGMTHDLPTDIWNETPFSYDVYAEYVGGTAVLGYSYGASPNGPITERYVLNTISPALELATSEYNITTNQTVNNPFAVAYGVPFTILERHTGYLHEGYDAYREDWWANVTATVTLASVSETNPYAASVTPTPIPSAILLLGVGLAVLAGHRKHKS